jgi:hypothetical protein
MSVRRGSRVSAVFTSECQFVMSFGKKGKGLDVFHICVDW